MQQVKNGDKVEVHYEGRLADGTVFDSSKGRQPLEFKIGGGIVIQGFNDGVTGMSVGEKKVVNILSNEAYGSRQDDLFLEFPKERLPPGITPVIGTSLDMSDENGKAFPVIIYEITDDTIILDANHPLAGQDLTFNIELVSIECISPLIYTP